MRLAVRDRKHPTRRDVQRQDLQAVPAVRGVSSRGSLGGGGGSGARANSKRQVGRR